MKLYEEYLKRHNLDISLVRYCSSGSVIVKGENNTWILITIKWIDDIAHPGEYHIDFLVPKYNTISNELFEKLVPTTKKKWDDYEDYILGLMRSLKKVKPVQSSDIILVAWEMFVYCYDNFFTSQPSNIKEILFKSLDKDNPDRYEYYKDMTYYLALSYPNTMRIFRKEIIEKIEDYSEWLVKLCLEN